MNFSEEVIKGLEQQKVQRSVFQPTQTKGLQESGTSGKEASFPEVPKQEETYPVLYKDPQKQKQFEQRAADLSKVPMDGTDHSVWKEVQNVAAMGDGEARKKREAALLKKLKAYLKEQNWNSLIAPLHDGLHASDITAIIMEGLGRLDQVDKFNENDLYALLTGGVRNADFWDLTLNSLTKGYNTARYGEESFAAMNGENNEKDKYEHVLSGDDYQFATDHWLQDGVAGAFGQLGQQVRQWTHPRSLATGSAAALGAAIAGQAGPQVLAPEEAITVPGAFLTGVQAGAAANALEIEAGLAYNEMLEAGVSEKTARKVALAVGTVNAGLEMLQVDELLDAYKAAKKTGATKSFARRVLDELAARGIDVAKETGQEVLQEGVTIGGTQIASKIDNGKAAYSARQVGDRLLDTAKSSALTFGMLNLPAGANNVASNKVGRKTINQPEAEAVHQDFNSADNSQKAADKKAPAQKENLPELKFTDAEIQSIQNIGRKSVNNFNARDTAATEKLAQRHWEELGEKSPFYRAKNGDWRETEQTAVQIATKPDATRGVQKNTDTGWDIQVSGKVFNETRMHTAPANKAAQAYLPYINDIEKTQYC